MRRHDRSRVTSRAPRRSASPARSHRPGLLAGRLDNERQRQQERPRADRLGELRQPARAGGAGLGAHQQVRRGLSRASATTAAASSSTSPSSSPSSAPRSCSAPSYANVQPHSGSQANMARATSRCSKPGDTILGMSLDHGGHLTHGAKVNFSGKLFNVVQYGLDRDDRADRLRRRSQQARARAQAEADRRGLLGLPARHRLRARSARSPTRSARYLMVDMAHVAGLVAAGLYPNPVPHADVVTTTTHKTLRGPRGGLILCRARRDRQEAQLARCSPACRAAR